MAKKVSLKKGTNLYKHSVKRTSRSRLRKSIANSLRARYFPKKQENIRLARARRKQNRPKQKNASVLLRLKQSSVSLEDFKKDLGL